MTMKTKAVIIDLTNQMWDLFASVKLTLVLLLSIALTSILGTLLPQKQDPNEYLRVFGDFLFRFLDLFNVFDMYHSFWFQFLLLLLTLNIIVCSIERLSATWKAVFTKSPRFNPSGFRMAQREDLDSSHSVEALKDKYKGYVSRRFGRTALEETEKGFRIFAERYRWARLGVYVVHLSVVLLLTGSLIGLIFGFEGRATIVEGEATDRFRLDSGIMMPLGFEIKCNDLSVSHYRNGAVKEYRANLTVVDQGRAVASKEIIVNDPLRYGGISIYLSSFHELPGPGPAAVAARDPDEEISVRFVSNSSGKEHRVQTKMGVPVDLPEELGTFVVESYMGTASFGGQNIGEAYVGTLTLQNGSPTKVLLPARFPNFDKMRKGAVVISVEGEDAEPGKPMPQPEPRLYALCGVIKDPGVWAVYSGFILMIIGLIISFFVSHQRFCIEAAREGSGSKITVTGVSNRNRLGVQNRIRKIAASLAAMD